MRKASFFLFFVGTIGAVIACSSSRLGREFRRINAYHAFRQEAKHATNIFYTHLPLSSGGDSILPPLTLTYFAHEGKREAEGLLTQALETSQEYLKGQAKQEHGIPKEAIAEVRAVWKGRQELLLLLGDMKRLEAECRFCLSHYEDSPLRRISYKHLISALSAQGKVTEAEMLLDQHDRTSFGARDSLILRTYLEMVSENYPSATKGLRQLLSASDLTRYERAVLLRRQADFAKRNNNMHLATESLESLKSLLSLKNQKEYICIELWTLAPTKEKSGDITRWVEETTDRSSLRMDAVRQLRDLAYNEGDLYKALLLHEKAGLRDRGVQGLRDSLRYTALSRIKPDLETIHRYEHPSLFKRRKKYDTDTRNDIEDRQEDRRSFREIWGNIPEHDFWAMNSDQPAFSGQSLSVLKNSKGVSVESYQNALIRVALTCIELLSDSEQARAYLDKCIRINPKSSEGLYASELLSRI